MYCVHIIPPSFWGGCYVLYWVLVGWCTMKSNCRAPRRSGIWPASRTWALRGRWGQELQGPGWNQGENECEHRTQESFAFALRPALMLKTDRRWVENHAPYTPPGGHPAGSTNPRRKLSCINAGLIIAIVSVLGACGPPSARGTLL
jgi:hypothetical protein